jgi:hypothetical protein
MTSDQGIPGTNGLSQELTAPRPTRPLREPLVGSIAVVVVGVVIAIVTSLANLASGLGYAAISPSVMFSFVIGPLIFGALAFVASAFVSPIERATSRDAFLRAAFVVGAVGAAGLVVLSVLLSVGSFDDVRRSAVIDVAGSIIRSITLLAVFVAAVLIDRLGRPRAS